MCSVLVYVPVFMSFTCLSPLWPPARVAMQTLRAVPEKNYRGEGKISGRGSVENTINWLKKHFQSHRL